MTKGKNGKRHVFEVIFSLLFIIGVGAGAIFCAYAGSDTDDSLYSYLQSFFAEFSEGADKWAVAKRAIAINTRIFFVIMVSGFFSLGYIVCGGVITVKGFVTGFTAAAFVKYYGVRGVWLSLCNFPVGVIFIPSMLFFCVVSAGMSANPLRKERELTGAYIIMSIIMFVLFIVSAFCDGYLTTLLMQSASKGIVG